MIKVYKYGLRPPTTDVSVINYQILLAHRYYNKLIEIERERRRKFREIVAEYSRDDIDKLRECRIKYKEELEMLRDEARAEKVATRSRKVSPEIRRSIAVVCSRLSYLGEEIRRLENIIKHNPVVALQIEEIDQEALKEKKNARASCGVYWGTYLLIEQAVDAARKAHVDPKFQKWHGIGSVGVQIQKGMSILAAMYSSSNKLRINPVPATAWGKRRSKQQKTMVHICISTDEKHRPVWASWPMTMHRPIPESALIKNVKIKKERIECHDRWSIHITVDEKERDETCGIGVVAMDFGWRKIGDDNTLRVAYYKDQDGQHEAINLPACDIGALKKIDELRSIRRKSMNDMAGRLAGWISGLSDKPEWMVGSVLLFKSEARFHRFASTWRDNRFEGDEEGWNILEPWRKQDKHLWLWEANSRDQMFARRRNYYNIIATKLARRYKTLIIGKVNLMNFQIGRPPEFTSEEGKKEYEKRVKWQKNAACCSSFKEIVTHAFISRGGEVLVVNKDAMVEEAVTRTCHLCRFSGKWEKKEELTHICGECGKEWDRDYNSTTNLLRLFSERPDAIERKTTKRKAKFAKRHVKNGGARRAGDKVA